VRERSNQNIEEERVSIMDELEAARYQAEQARLEAAAAREEAAAARQEADSARREADEARLLAPGPRPLSPGSQEPGDREQETGDRSEDAAIVLHKMHNLHTPGDAKSDASHEPAGVYATKASAEKIYGESMHTPQALVLEEPLIPRAAKNDTFAESAHEPDARARARDQSRVCASG
jgi:hypothetical protein